MKHSVEVVTMITFASPVAFGGRRASLQCRSFVCPPQKLGLCMISRRHRDITHKPSFGGGARPRMCAQVRETDARGFVLPVPGDVVLFPGRWADEDAAGLVEAVRPREGSTDSSIVDVVEMRDIGETVFEATRKRRWFDAADVRIALDAEYLPSQDAYRVSSARSGYAEVPPMDAAQKAAADAEYAELKTRMLLTTVAAGVTGTAVASVGFSLDVAYAFALGSAASVAYLFLLQSSVDAVGGTGNGVTGASLVSRLVGLRFLVPALPFLILSTGSGTSSHGSVTGDGDLLTSLIGSLSATQAGAIILGLLTYKVPLVSQTGSEAVESLAEMPLNSGTTGMVGTIAGLTARAVKSRGTSPSELKESATELGSPALKSNRPLFVFAGPSGAGKSTLIKKLFEEFPATFGFSVSHTTRSPREGEVDGVDYNFVDEAAFAALVEDNAFLEYATVHGNSYGTTVAAVGRVIESGMSCILDLDVQGVEALAAREDAPWSARFVWVAPPSMEALEARLAARGTETPESMAKRLDTATRELTFAATSRIFDITIINAEISKAYKELSTFIRRELGL